MPEFRHVRAIADPRVMRALTFVLAVGCRAAEPAPAPVVAARPLPIQIKGDAHLVVRGEPAPYSLGDDALVIDGRSIPVAGPRDRMADIAREVARVPPELRALLTELRVSPEPNPDDAAWTAKYGAPVQSGMTAVASGRITVYPHGIEELDRADRDFFARNLLHELGHCWSLREWSANPASKAAWLDAIATDAGAPSQYALVSFRKSHLPFEDVAEATALWFLVRGTSEYASYRASMPGRFALLEARFARAT